MGKGLWNPKRKMWVTTHFSGKLSYHDSKKALKIQRTYVTFYPNLSSIISEKFSFWILIALAKICFFHVVINRTKILLY